MASAPRRMILLALYIFAASLVQPGFGEDTSSKTESKTVRVGVAVPRNRSRRGVDTTWERAQLVREIKSLRKDKHSPILIEAVGLDSSDREEALDEAAKKDCDFVVTTLLIDPTSPGNGGVVLGPGGVQPNPTILGNSDPRRNLAVEFALVRLGTGRNFASGIASVPARDGDDTGAATDAMRSVALQVAHEIRKDRPAVPE